MICLDISIRQKLLLYFTVCSHDNDLFTWHCKCRWFIGILVHYVDDFAFFPRTNYRKNKENIWDDHAWKCLYKLKQCKLIKFCIFQLSAMSRAESCVESKTNELNAEDTNKARYKIWKIGLYRNTENHPIVKKQRNL